MTGPTTAELRVEDRDTEQRNEDIAFRALVAAERLEYDITDGGNGGSLHRPIIRDIRGEGRNDEVHLSNEGNGMVITHATIAGVTYTFDGRNPEQERRDIQTIMARNPDLGLALDALNVIRRDPNAVDAFDAAIRGQIVPDIREGHTQVNR